ncbi:MAG: isoaspartyl peptidase/L-asparaginase family protein [Phototrophicaceae bacterium]
MTQQILPRLIVHGGAGPWIEDNHDQALEGVRAAASAGWAVLRDGGSALDAVEAATVVLENDPLFDAGFGSFLNDQGEVEMDALITDGHLMDFGAIAAVKHVRNPIRLARRVMTSSPHRFFVAEGADLLAIEYGLERAANLSFVTDSEWRAFAARVAKNGPPEPGRGTVGAVALDAAGHIASATSTGGSPHKKKGRVGDVPIYGAGGYSDDAYGGASSTGVGENIMRHLLSKRVVDVIALGSLTESAAQASVDVVASRIPSPEVGVIALDAGGHYGAAHTTRHMPIGWIDADGSAQAGMSAPYPLG